MDKIMSAAKVQQEKDNTVEVRKTEWYETVSYEDAKAFIKTNIVSAARSFIAIGFYLKHIRDGELFREEGHASIWDFAQAEYGISKSTASRYMAMNDRFSKNGNSPVVADQYKEFDKSKLQEMLYLTDEQLEQVNPGMKVQEIREIRKPKEVPYFEMEGQLDFKTRFPEVMPEPVPEEKPETQVFEKSAEDLMGENPEGGEEVAISQQPEMTGKCIHRPNFNCALPEQDKQIAGDGEDCSHKCCWNCPKHEACRLECYASAQRPENAAETQQNKPEETTAPVFTSELSNNSAYGWTWHEVVKSYLSEVHKERNNEADRSFHEAVFNSYGFTYQASVKGEQVVFLTDEEVQFIVNMDRLNREYDFFYPSPKEELSAYGTKRKIYPPDSLIATSGCEGGHDCFSCAMECQIRQADRYCREAPMGNPFPCEIMIWGLQNQRDEVGDRCQFINHDLADHYAGSGEVNPCCKNCSDPCEYICARAMQKLDEQQEEAKPELRQEEDSGPEDNVINVEYTEVEESAPDKLEPVRAVLQKESTELNDWLKAFEGEPPERIPSAVEHKKIIVAALAAMISDLEDTELQKQQEWPRAEQPELPVMRNNDQRKEFLNTFHDWPVWFRVPEASEVYYRYDLPDRTALVICEYRYYAEWMKRYSDMEPERAGTREYFLTPGYHYLDDCKSNRSTMVEKLKEIQKKGTDADE